MVTLYTVIVLEIECCTDEWLYRSAFFSQSNQFYFVEGMFLEHKCNTGVKTDQLAYEKFTEDWSSLKFKPPLCNQAMMLPRR